MKEKYVSVIIPVYKDWYRLGLCVNALATQRYNSDLFEVIIVNNSPESTMPEGFYLPPNCRVINESKKGSYAARNAGIRQAIGDIIAFTDSDCIPDKKWVAEGVKALDNNPTFGRIAGKIQLHFKSDKRTTADLYEMVYAFNQELYVKNDGTCVTANLFTYRYVLDSVGLFNENLLSGGDYDWSIRAQKAGYSILYAEDVKVSHPARGDMKELITKAKRVGGGQAGFNGEAHKKNRVATAIKLVYDLRPPLKSLSLIRIRGKSLHPLQKVSVGCVRYFLSVITAIEKAKVSLGKTAQRY